MTLSIGKGALKENYSILTSSSLPLVSTGSKIAHTAHTMHTAAYVPSPPLIVFLNKTCTFVIKLVLLSDQNKTVINSIYFSYERSNHSSST
jgi:hypothetical protein